MKKSLLLVFFILGLTLILYLVFQNSPSSSPSALNSSTQLTQVDESSRIQSGELEDPDSIGTSSYQLYTPQAFAAANTRRLLFFYANWCPTCKPVDQELQARAGELPSNLTIFRVNYNDDQVDEDEQAIATDHSITYQHTFVQVDQDGNSLQTWNGGGFDTILENLQ